MNCTEAEFMIQRHYDGELSFQEEAILEQHLLACDTCQQEFDEYGEFFGDIACLAVQVEHRDVLSQTLVRLEEAKSKRKMDFWYRGVAVAAAVVVIASTAVLSLTDTGRAVQSRVASIFGSETAPSKLLSAEAAAEQQELNVTDDHDAALFALQKIREQVNFPLLELRDESLSIESTSLIGGDETAMYQMVELVYAVRDSSGHADRLSVIATPDASLKAKAKSYIGLYEFQDEYKFGPFIWAKVGDHAITAEINGIFYQLFSPFLTTEELGKYAMSIGEVVK